MAQPTAPSTPRVRRVLAGPGSGKTKLLTEQLRDRLAAGMAPASMLGLTFSRRAAREMQARLSRPAGRSPWLGTFHALAWRILSDAHSLPSAPDLDALIPQATRLLQAGTVPPWLPLVQYIAVDEAQDLDATQVEFLKALRHHMTTPELLLVGDPDQAIYGFRQASADYLLKAETTFAEPCKTTILAENHRSAKAIVEAARQILGPSADPQAPCHRLAATRPEAHPAIRWIIARTPEGEATRIFEEIRTLLALNVPANSIAILMRTRAQTVPLEAEAATWKLPVFSPAARSTRGRARTPRPVAQRYLDSHHASKQRHGVHLRLPGRGAGRARAPPSRRPARGTPGGTPTPLRGRHEGQAAPLVLPSRRPVALSHLDHHHDGHTHPQPATELAPLAGPLLPEWKGRMMSATPRSRPPGRDISLPTLVRCAPPQRRRGHPSLFSSLAPEAGPSHRVPLGVPA